VFRFDFTSERVFFILLDQNDCHKDLKNEGIHRSLSVMPKKKKRDKENTLLLPGASPHGDLQEERWSLYPHAVARAFFFFF
jgi:hypothetical protein